MARLMKPSIRDDGKTLRDLVLDAEGYKDDAEAAEGTASAAAVTATAQASTAATQAGIAAAHVATSQSNALAAASSAASIQDTAARVGAMLKTRGITNIKAIAFKSAEGWEKTGRQSYKTETRPAGRFLGDYTTATTAWAANYQSIATVAGDYYWHTANISLHECTTENESTVVRRAGSDHIPLEAVFVFHSNDTAARIRVFDLTDPMMPMWMDFVAATNTLLGATSGTPAFNLAQIDYKDGILAVSKFRSSGPAGTSFHMINFIQDTEHRYSSTGLFQWAGTLSQRNSALGTKILSTSFSLPNGSTKSATRYKDFCLFTDSNTSFSSGRVVVVKPDLTAVGSLSTQAYKAIAVLNDRLFSINDTLAPESLVDFGQIDKLGANFGVVSSWKNNTIPAFLSHTLTELCSSENSLIVRSAIAVEQLWPNPTDAESSLIARKGLGFAAPPMKKASSMLICSTVEGTVSESDLYEFDFTTGVDGWFAVGGNSYVTWDEANQRLIIDRDSGLGAASGLARSSNILEVGKFYFLRQTVASSPGSMRFELASCRVIHGPNGGYYSGAGVHEWLIQATQTYYEIKLSNTYGDTFFSEIDVTGVVPDFSDRSRFNTLNNTPTHATINGTLTATAEIAGGVAGLSGFSAANYLECPYDADLDVGTGDFCYSFAFKSAGNSEQEYLLCRGDAASSGGRLQIHLQTNGTVRVLVSGVQRAISSSAYDDSGIHTCLLYRQAGVVYLEVDGRIVASGADTTDLSNDTAIVTVGVRPDIAFPATTSTIWFACASAVAPTAEEAALMHTHMRNLILNKANLDEIPTALAYSPLTKAVEMVGATKRQTMIDGAIVSSVNHGRGTTPAAAAGSRGEIAVGGTTGLSISAPERNLREYEARLTRERFTVKYAGNATGSRVLFPLPTTAAEMSVTLDAKPVRVSNAGVVQTEGSSDDYTVKDYGLGRYAVQFAVAPADGNDVLVEFEREVYK